jgi:hypothetical protein
MARTRGKDFAIDTGGDHGPQVLLDHPDRGRMEALYDQKLHNAQIRRERSAAFWMAASIWGVSGLVIGSCLGALMMFYAYTGMTPTVRDNLMAGAAMDEARDSVNSRDPLMSTDPDASR